MARKNCNAQKLTVMGRRKKLRELRRIKKQYAILTAR
jgi:hypothetical protein